MLPENITQARDAATSAATSVGNLTAGSYTIGDVLKKKVTEAYADNQDIIGNLDTATAGYVGAPSAGREKFSNIFNPTQKESLVSQYTGNQSIPMLSLASILGQRFGRIEDTIGAGTRGYQGMVAGEQARATNLQDIYTNLLNEYQIGENTRQALEAERLAREKLQYDKSNAGSGAYDLASALALLGIGGNQDTSVWEDVTPEPAQEQPTWQDPLREIQKQQEKRALVDRAVSSGANLSGLKGLNSNVMY